ncbi:site-2 protease family protein [Siccirubricoccus sp. G192]|uniref:site-2 protease family protein n=1 Tax=Siccirubricoccus sp. G192 TaxID=2849651 RepID=UPI001C2BADA5|nr:site-2 protease family protein [Siccirubricoccus sp. G192]MBV1798171.1 site-2 protease family protein [Siccirubricoccus sp. G192]
MGWSIPIGRILGTEIRLHLTFVLFLLWIGAAYYAQGGWDAAVEGVAFMGLLFACVVLHEFGHVLAARRYGVQTPDITLLPIGGVARLERIPEEPAQELVVALAGPAVNLVIAVLLVLALGGVPPMEAAAPQDAGAGLAGRLFWVNLFLVGFNLIPAFPMDGGRVLRALLAWRMGFARATQVAASVGQMLAIGLGLLGLFGNPLLLFIALFVWMGAAGEAHAAQLREVSRGLRVADAMVTRFESLSPASTVDNAVQCLIRTTQHDFPVVDGGGRLRGVVTQDAIIRALRERGPETPVLEVMRPDIPVVHHRGSLEEALRLLQDKAVPAVGAVDQDGRLVGLVTPENLGEMMLLHAARPARANPWQRPA